MKDLNIVVAVNKDTAAATLKLDATPILGDRFDVLSSLTALAGC
jgi:electron transfer flavoprotein alpha subunit